MFTEKTKLVDKRDNPFYGSYKENNIMEEIHWQNKRKRQQLAMVSGTVLILVLLAIGITLAITLPPLLDDSVSLSPPDPDTFFGPSSSKLKQFSKAAVSSESTVCSDMGRDILQNSGGNAVDAAVTVTLCHGVTNPQSSGLGGGAFLVIYIGNQTYAINARETAPLNADPLVYQENTSKQGGLVVGVPGELLGLWEAHQRFGKVEWSVLVKPVRDLAENGISVSSQLAKSMKEYEKKIKKDPVMSSEFVNPATGNVWIEGDVLKRPKLAATLQKLQDSGITEFYNGTLASNIVNEVSNANGIINLEDLSAYRVEWDTPFVYNLTGNLTLHSLAFPSSGPVVALALGILHGFGRKINQDLNVKERGLDDHLLAEVLKFSHAHRSLISDPNFADMSELLDKMLSEDYATDLRDLIDPYKTFDDPGHYGAVYSPIEDSGTSQISILGPEGDAVSITTSINLGFGAGFMGETTGIIYNNVMLDFSIGNETDDYGLPPNQLNQIEPGKRPASSMCPILLVNDKGQPVLASGGTGGGKIVSAVISTTWRALYRNLDIKEAIDYPRFAPTFNPSIMYYEFGLPKSVVSELRRRGHKMERLSNSTEINTLGSVNAVCKTKQSGLILGNADYRKHGDSAGY